MDLMVCSIDYGSLESINNVLARRRKGEAFFSLVCRWNKAFLQLFSIFCPLFSIIIKFNIFSSACEVVSKNSRRRKNAHPKINFPGKTVLLVIAQETRLDINGAIKDDEESLFSANATFSTRLSSSSIILPNKIWTLLANNLFSAFQISLVVLHERPAHLPGKIPSPREFAYYPRVDINRSPPNSAVMRAEFHLPRLR